MSKKRQSAASQSSRPKVQQVTVPPGYHQVELTLPGVRVLGKTRRTPQVIRVHTLPKVRLVLNKEGKPQGNKWFVPPGAEVVRLVFASAEGIAVRDRDTWPVTLKEGVSEVLVLIPAVVDVSSIDFQQVLAVLRGMEDDDQGYHRMEQAFEVVVLQPSEDGSDLPSQLRTFVAKGGDLYKLAMQAVEEDSRGQPMKRGVKERWAKRLGDRLMQLAETPIQGGLFGLSGRW